MTRPAQGVQLDPLRGLPLKEQVVRRLAGLIEEGVLQPGDRLPSERELSEQLRVSRGTVREAVQFLHALGLMEIRHGSGTFVRVSSGDQEGLRDEWRRWTLRHAERVRELLEVRKGLESFAAELAAERADETSLETMSIALERMEAAVGAPDVTALVQADVLFHRALCAAAGNAALSELADALGEQLLRERGATWDLPGRPARSLAEHGEIEHAVRAGDASRARESVLAHLESVERDVGGLRAMSEANHLRER